MTAAMGVYHFEKLRDRLYKAARDAGEPPGYQTVLAGLLAPYGVDRISRLPIEYHEQVARRFESAMGLGYFEHGDGI